MFWVLRFAFSFFFFFLVMRLRRQQLLFVHCSWTVAALFDFSTPFNTSVGPVNSARDSQISFFINFFTKNGSYGTIHTFLNYFATVFSVFNFNKISFIQTNPRCNPKLEFLSKLTLTYHWSANCNKGHSLGYKTCILKI